MHIQARSGTTQVLFTDDDDGDGLLVSASYGGAGLSDILAVLQEHGFNIRGAGGQRIELGGEFSYWVERRFDADGNAIDDDHEDATRKAADLVAAAGFDTRLVEVEHRLLTDEPGALRAFVADIGDRGGMVEELSVGTPDSDGRIPVQAYVSQQR